MRVDLTDAEAVSAVMAGHRERFEIIVRHYNRQLYRVGRAYLHDHAQTEDAMQNAYLKAFLNLSHFHGTSSFGTWLTRIMINECLMLIRSKKRFVTETLDHGQARVEHASFFAPATPDSLLNQDIKAVLETALQALPRLHRAVYVLREVQHLSTAETARCLNISCGNVKVSLHRALEELKTQLINSAAGIELYDYPARFCDPMTAAVMSAIPGSPTHPAA